MLFFGPLCRHFRRRRLSFALDRSRPWWLLLYLRSSHSTYAHHTHVYPLHPSVSTYISTYLLTCWEYLYIPQAINHIADRYGRARLRRGDLHPHTPLSPTPKLPNSHPKSGRLHLAYLFCFIFWTTNPVYLGWPRSRPDQLRTSR